VVTGRLVLARARWRLHQGKLKPSYLALRKLRLDQGVVIGIQSKTIFPSETFLVAP
jgi:hypothetical protein